MSKGYVVALLKLTNQERFVEDYASINQSCLKVFPKTPKTIFTANFIFDEGLTFWTAFHVEKGAKLIVSQHGGGYGSHLWSFLESHEINYIYLDFKNFKLCELIDYSQYLNKKIMDSPLYIHHDNKKIFKKFVKLFLFYLGQKHSTY